jgi:hypothetical protein
MNGWQRPAAPQAPLDLGIIAGKRRGKTVCDQKTAIEAELKVIEDAPPLTINDLSLLDELPHALGLLTAAPRNV